MSGSFTLISFKKKQIYYADSIDLLCHVNDSSNSSLA